MYSHNLGAHIATEIVSVGRENRRYYICYNYDKDILNMITQEQINQIIKAIVAGYAPRKIILFGSYALGSPARDSDIDLLIIKDDNLPKIQRNRIVRSFLKDFSFPVDVIVKTSQEFEMFKNVIGSVVYAANKYGKVLYG